MSKFLLEVPHADDIRECTSVVQVFLSSGSHLLTNAEWGCEDGVHNAWMIVDVDTKDEARGIVPPAFRSVARVTALNTFTLEYINSEIARLEAEAAT